MLKSNYRRAQTLLVGFLMVALYAMPLVAFAQTPVRAPSNKYSVNDDVKLGREAAQQVESQMPILNDRDVEAYVNRVGQNLVASIPPEFQHREFQYTFRVVNARDINAFALPGGPMYVNRGMIEAAQTEGEMAGVMAHEISHVALRHATAQATETSKFQIGSVLGQIAGAVIGGGIGQVIGGASQIGFGAMALKYSRKYETQADILGAQIMARAGYDPRDLARMFQTIQRQSGGSGGPEWLSSHPNPGNRYETINREAAMLNVAPNPNRDTRQFVYVKNRLREMGRAPSMEEIARSGQRYPNGGGTTNSRYPNDSRVSSRVEYPSTQFRTYTGGNFFQIAVPANWRDFGSQDSVTFAPDGAFGDYQGQSIFTHGAMVGVANVQARNLREASDQFINALLQNNPYLRQSGGYRSGSLGADGRSALALVLSGRSTATGRDERVTVYTTQLRNGGLFYVITVSPQDEYRYYDRAFQTMLNSLRING